MPRDTPACSVPTLAEVGPVHEVTGDESAAAARLVDRYGLDAADKQLLAAILGI